MRMTDWLTPEEQAQVNDKNFEGFQRLCYHRQNEAHMWKGFRWSIVVGMALLALWMLLS